MTAEELLAGALAAEDARNWDESFALCQRALAASPRNPDGLNLFGRLCGLAGDPARAAALQTFALRIDPNHRRARVDLAVATANAAPAQSREYLVLATAQEPDVACHRRHPMSLVPFACMDRCERLLRRSIELDPANAPAHAAIGNVYARLMRRLDAINAYELAIMLDWSFADAHLALSGLYESLQNAEAATSHRREALSIKRGYEPCPSPAPPIRTILAIAVDGGAQANLPLEFLLNMHRTAMHVHYVDPPGMPAVLPSHDVLVNAMEYLESSAAAIEACATIASRSAAPLINDPRNLPRIARTELPHTLRDIAVQVPVSARIARERLSSVSTEGDIVSQLPIVIRPVDTHRGEGLERIDRASGLAAYLQRTAGETFVVAPFIDYRGDDGYYRKYRAIFVDGRAFAYHLAISDRWMVHYEGSLMETHPWMRAEEERFLREPEAVFPEWDRSFAKIAGAIGLDYFGIDFTKLRDGSTLIFEAGAAMLVHCRDRLDLFAYKYDYVPRIFDAFEAMLDARVNARSQ